MIGFERGDILYELWIARGALWSALQITCVVALSGLVIGLAIGMLGAMIAVFGPRWLAHVIAGYVYVVRGVPLLVTIFFVYFGLAALWRALPAETAGILALGLYAGAQLTEVFRGALQSVPRGQIEAAKAIGLTFIQRFLDVIAPLSIRRALPSVVNMAVDLIKASTLLAALGVGELLLTGQQVAMRTLLIAQVYLSLWIFYFSINASLTLLGRWLEARYRHVIY